MIWIILLLILGIALIVKGGDLFVDGSVWIAEKSGIPKFIIGATIVSVGTTLPELVTSIFAIIEGSNSMAISNAVGSVVANTGLIMAIAIIAMPIVIDRKAFSFKGILLLVVATLLLLFLLDYKLFLWESIIILLMFIVFLVENIISSKRESQINKMLCSNNNNGNECIKEAEPIELEVIDIDASKENAIRKNETYTNIIKFIVGITAIILGSDLLVNNGKKLVVSFGISETIIGLTILAIGTSLPELVTTISAIIKKQGSLSVGNIIGANIIDLAIILPVCAFIGGGILELGSNQTVYWDLPMCILIMFIAILPTLIFKKFHKWQGYLMLGLYLCFIIVACLGILPF